jgi:glycerol-3-phosphate dehydrogenase
MRPRVLDRLTVPHDVLIAGGGIYGLALAAECASRGLSTALVEADDFGSGTSFNLQKTAHGGLRSLQSGRLDRARESIRERRALARIAPWLLRPLPFLVGTYRSVTRGRLALRAAFALDAALGRDRNEGVPPELHLPAPRLVSRAAAARLFPGIRPEGLTGGAQWYDYQIVETDRLTFAFAEAADRAGADLVNHAEAVGSLTAGSRITGLVVRDRLTGTTLEAPAAVVVNAAGWRGAEVMGLFGVSQSIPLVRAINLVTRRPARDLALAAPTRAGRMLTLVPWRGCALVGTGQTTTVVGSGDRGLPEADVEAFIAEANEAFPALGLTRADVTLVHRGLVPAVVDSQGRASLRPSPIVRDHAADGVAGAISMIGVKYTTARGVAERTAGLIAGRLGKPLRPSRSGTTPLPGAGLADHEALAIERAKRRALDLPPATIRHLTARYAERAAAIVDIIGGRPDLAAPVAPDVPTIAAEVVAAIRDEMALRLGDIVIRRTGLGDRGHPGADAIAGCARVAALELGWDAARVAQEVADLERFYAIDGTSRTQA